jgi:hypothetical protein
LGSADGVGIGVGEGVGVEGAGVEVGVLLGVRVGGGVGIIVGVGGQGHGLRTTITITAMTQIRQHNPPMMVTIPQARQVHLERSQSLHPVDGVGESGIWSCVTLAHALLRNPVQSDLLGLLGVLV